MFKMRYIGLLIGCALLLSFGCKPNHRFVCEDFKIACVESNILDGICDMSIYGSEQSVAMCKEEKTSINLTYIKSPYRIVVIFKFPRSRSGSVELRTVSIFENTNKICVVNVDQRQVLRNFIAYQQGNVRKVEERKESSSCFFIEQVDIPHIKVKVFLSTVIPTELGEVEKTWEFELTPVIKEELRNDQLDAMKSV